MAFVVIILLLTSFSRIVYSQTAIGVDCQFQQGSNFNCRQYCSSYFKAQPQLAWYNITSKKCQPLKVCALINNYHHYEDNQCYQDRTLNKVAASYYPETLNSWLIKQNAGHAECIYGQPFSKKQWDDVQCLCYFMWQSSGTYDIYGYKFLCDKVVEKENWGGYFINDMIKDKNGTVLMYGPYTPTQMQFLYNELKQQQKELTLKIIQKYQESMFQVIETILPLQPIIRDNQVIFAIIGAILVYILFSLSYLRFESQIIKVSKKQMINRVLSIIEDENAFQGNK